MAAQCEPFGNPDNEGDEVTIEVLFHAIESFECKVQRLAPPCARRGHPLGHGVKVGGRSSSRRHGVRTPKHVAPAAELPPTQNLATPTLS